MFDTPFLGELAGGGGGEDGLAEAFEEVGDAVEAGAAGFHPPSTASSLSAIRFARRAGREEWRNLSGICSEARHIQCHGLHC